MFKRHVYVIQGWKQDRSSRSGLLKFWQSMYRQHLSEDSLITAHSWDANFRAEAEFVFRVSAAQPKIAVVAFSWGAGWGFVKFAKELKRRGLGIHHACLIDPVYRHWYWLGNWRSFVPAIPILIPSNVKFVTWWRQYQSWPRGHQLLGFGPTNIRDPTVIDSAHQYMDDNPQVLRDCSEIINAFMED